MWNNRDNNSSAGLALFLLFLGFIFLGSNSGAIFLMLAVIGVLAFLRNYDRRIIQRSLNQQAARTRAQPRYDDDYGAFEDEEDELESLPEDTYQTDERDTVYRHALQAVAEAGKDPSNVSVLVTDIGVMAAKRDETPTLYRTWTIPDDSEYAHPFVQLRVPMNASGKIKFELLDASGKAVFIDEGYYQLHEGKNLIVPSTRLPLETHSALRGKWSLKISADGVLLAHHRFEFQTAKQSEVRKHMREDGEIEAAMNRHLAEGTSKRGGMSLDELLANQDDDELRAKRL